MEVADHEDADFVGGFEVSTRKSQDIALTNCRPPDRSTSGDDRLGCRSISGRNVPQPQFPAWRRFCNFHYQPHRIKHFTPKASHGSCETYLPNFREPTSINKKLRHDISRRCYLKHHTKHANNQSLEPKSRSHPHPRGCLLYDIRSNHELQRAADREGHETYNWHHQYHPMVRIIRRWACHSIKYRSTRRSLRCQLAGLPAALQGNSPPVPMALNCLPASAATIETTPQTNLAVSAMCRLQTTRAPRRMAYLPLQIIRAF